MEGVLGVEYWKTGEAIVTYGFQETISSKESIVSFA